MPPARSFPAPSCPCFRASGAAWAVKVFWGLSDHPSGCRLIGNQPSRKAALRDVCMAYCLGSRSHFRVMSLSLLPGTPADVYFKSPLLRSVSTSLAGLLSPHGALQPGCCEWPPSTCSSWRQEGTLPLAGTDTFQSPLMPHPLEQPLAIVLCGRIGWERCLCATGNGGAEQSSDLSVSHNE